MKIANVILIALLISVAGRIIVLYPLNTNLLEGTDFTAHVPKIWYLANAYEKYGDWNPFWYGGYPFLKYYSPLSYYIAGFFAFFTDAAIAYKIVINIFFLLAPIVFYLFIREFKLNNNQKAIGILVFSFFITNIYYFWNNAFPTVVNLVFIIFTWIFFKKYAENKNSRNLAFASLFFGLSVLTHQLTALLNLILIFSWLFVKNRGFIFHSILPVIFGLLISSFWLFPFLLEFEKNIIKFPEIFTFLNNIIYHIGFFGFVLLSALSGILFLMSLKLKVEKSFLVVLILIFLIILFSEQYRIIALIPIALAVFMAELYKKTRLPVIALMLAFIVLFYSYHAFSFYGHEPWEIPSAKNRVIYIPSPNEFCLPDENCYRFLYSAYLGPLNGQEIITGWFQESQKIGKLKHTKWVYLNKIGAPLKHSDYEYYSLLKQGFVNSVVVNKFYPEYIEYFNGSDFFKKVNETEHFVVFELDPRGSYIEANNISINYNIKRDVNKITIWFDCKPGELIIKESYDKNWKIYDNFESKYIDFNANEYGFIKTNISGDGKCMLTLSYKKNTVFLLASLFSLILLSFINFKRK